MNNMNDKSKEKSSCSSGESCATKNGKGYAATPDKNARPNGQARKQAPPREEDRDQVEY